MANDEYVQNKLREELMNTFKANSGNITYQDLKNLSYLELVIKETLRMYPSVPFFSRSLNEEAVLGLYKYQLRDSFHYLMYENLPDGVKLPKHCTITIIPYIIHRDSRIYPDPEKFDPDRFKNMNSQSPYAYIPFSAGPRNCIGKN